MNPRVQQMINWDSMNNWGMSGNPAPVAGQVPLNMSLPAEAGGTNIGLASGVDGLVPQSAMMGAAGTGFLQGMLGYRMGDGTQVNGWGGTALSVGQSLMNGYLGMKQLGIAKDQLAQSKKQFDLNFGAQRKLTNSRLEDRQAARVASNPSAYQSVGDYMAKNGI